MFSLKLIFFFCLYRKGYQIFYSRAIVEPNTARDAAHK